MVGPRDDRWRRRFNVGSLADHGVWARSLAEITDTTGRDAVLHVGRP